VKVTYQSGPELGDLKASATVKDVKVVGKNPARADVEALVAEIGGTQTWCLIRMFCHESAHKLGQFKNGEVLYGPPAGVGIVQRDPEGDEWVWPASRLTEPSNFFPRIFWDWKKNVREGVERFRSDYMQRARNEIAALRRKNPSLPEASEEIILRSAIRHYNGGNEYQASADGAHYVVDPYQSKNKDGTLKALKADRLPYVNQVLDDSHVDATKYPVPADVRAETWPAVVENVPIPVPRPRR
jgi:type VI secretion system secreted protein VgrG